MEKEKHVFVTAIEDLYLLSKDVIEKSDAVLKKLENYKLSASLSFKNGELEKRHYHLFDALSARVAQICSGRDIDNPDWILNDDFDYKVCFINSKGVKVEDLSIDFQNLYSKMPEQYEKTLFLRRMIYALSLSTSDHVVRAKLESYRRRLKGILRDIEAEEEGDDDDLNGFFSKTEKLFTDKKKLGSMINGFAGMYEKIRKSEVGEVVSNSIPDGTEINEDTIKNTILTVQSKINGDPSASNVITNRKS
jgi:hypothetical protein